MKEAAFGPVLLMLRFSEIDEVTPLASNSSYRLAGSVSTNDLGIARRYYPAAANRDYMD